MREKLRDSGRLEHIIEAIDNAFEFVEGKTFDEYCRNKMLRFAVDRSLHIIGEASYMLSKELKEQHPEIDWKKIISMRHIMVHGYHHVQDEIVWTTVKERLPQLKEQINRIINSQKSKID